MTSGRFIRNEEIFMKKTLMKVLKICAFVLGGLVALVVVFLGVLNLLKFAIYSEYYSAKTNVCRNPGLSDGFVCQGITVHGNEEKIIISGYMKDHSASRLYVTDTDNNSYYVTLSYASGKEFTGHAGGVAISGEYAYIANGKKLHAVTLDSILNAKNGESVEITESIPVNNQASFVFADDSYIYVGEFHDGGAYVTEHPYETPDGTYHAIVSKYAKTAIEAYDKETNPTLTPEKIYSIRNKVQGICFTPDGKVMMSTSYGLADSVYYVYNEADAIDSGKTLDGAPLYYLCETTQVMKGPAMSEDLECKNGKIYTMTESASDKYIFGKFFFANKIIAFDTDDLK